MGLKINIEEVLTDFSKVELSNDDGNVAFKLSSHDAGMGVLFPFPFPITETIPDTNTSKVFIFKNKHFRANDLIQFRVHKKNTKKEDNGLIGYFFSSQLLLEESGLETFEKEKYSIIYALTGIEIILKNEANTISLPPKTVDLEEDSELDISHLYDEDIIILVINQNMLKNPAEFDIDHYLCDFYKYGFYLLTQHDTEIYYNQLDVIKNNFGSARKQSSHKFINVKTSSSDIDIQNPKSYYNILLHQLITQKSEFITSFISLYQVIELLKDEVLHNEMQVLAPYKTGYEIEQAVKELSKTPTLLKKLFGSDYSKLNGQNVIDLTKYLNTFFKEISEPAKKETNTRILIDDLKDILSKHTGNPKSKGRKSLHDDILKKLDGLESKANRKIFTVLLYQFRNTMVHNYSKVIQEEVDDRLLNNIQMRFEYLIIDLIHTFHLSPTSPSSP